MNGEAYCTECKGFYPYVVGAYLSKAVFTYNNEKISVPVKVEVAHCCRCFSEVYVSEIEDRNAELREEAVSRYKQVL